MDSWTKSGLKLLIAFPIVLVLGIFILFHLFDTTGLCANKVFKEVFSPNKKIKAVLFSRDCGATTDFSTQISIMHQYESLKNKETGNLFISDSDHGKAPRGITGGSPVKIDWITDDSIHITYHSDARIFKKIMKCKGIKIGYSSLSDFYETGK